MSRIGLVLRLFALSARLQKKRALLTVAAIAWGTVTILLLLAFGEGLKRQMTRNSAAMGENIAVRWMGETSKAWKGLPPGRPVRLRMEDVDFVRERLPQLAGVFGEMANWRVALAYGPKTVTGHVIGTYDVYGEIRKHYPVAGGRFLSPLDVSEQRRVVFLGNELAKNVFKDEDPVGKTLLLNNTPFTVIGVMVKKTQAGAYGGMDKDHAIIPITTYKALFGQDRLEVLVVKVHRPEEMKAALREVNEALSARHGFDPTDDRVFPTWDTVKSGESRAKVLLGIEIFLGIIGGLTLVTGGVGVANIMYAVVRERTREIGVKMALGARSAWIVGPIVLEGLVYTLLGGLAGTTIAFVIVTALGLIPTEGNQALEFLGKPTISLPIAAGTSAILGAIGLLAGYFPARKAAAIDPAHTLRYE